MAIIPVPNACANCGGGGGTTSDVCVVCPVTIGTILDDITVNQGTSPWVISGTVCISDCGGSITVDGTVELGAATLAALETVTVLQGTSPWVVSGSFSATVASDHAEDSPHTSGDIGSFALGVRNDTHGVLTSTDLDYSPLSVDSSGALNVADNGGSLTVDGTVAATQSGAWTVTANQGTSPWIVGDGGGSITVDGTVELGATTLAALETITVLQGTSPWVVSGTVSATVASDHAEDAPHVSGDIGSFALGVRNDAHATFTSANGDYSPLSVDASGALNVADNGGSLTVDDGGGSITVDGTVTVLQGTSPWVVSGTVTSDVTFDYPEDSGHSSGDIGAFVLAVRNDGLVDMTNNDMDYSPIAVNSQGVVWTQVTGTVATFDNHLEDSPHVSGDIGAFVLAVRNDAHAVLTSANLDYSPFSVDSSGALNIADNGGSITVDGTVTVLQGTSPWVVSGAVTTTDAADHAEDAPHVSGDIGSFSLGVRNDANAVLTSANGDYSPFSVTSSGALNIADAGGSITVDGTVNVTQGTSPWVVSGTVGTNAERAEDSPHTSGQTGDFVLAVRNDTHGVLTSTDLDYSPFSVDSSGALNIADNGGSITVDGTVTVTQGTSPWIISGTVTADTELPAASALADADPNPTTSRIGSNALVFNGTTWDRLYEPSSDGFPAAGTGLAGIGNMVYNSTGAVWERMRRASADGLAGTGILASGSMVWNGTNWDRLKEPTADGVTVVGIPSAGGMVFNSGAGTWSRMREGTSQGSVLASAEKAEDSAHTSGQTGTFVLGVRNDAGAAMTDANLDYSPITTDSTGAVRVTGTVTATAGTARDDTDNQAVVTTGAGLQVVRNYLFDGTDWDRERSVVGLADANAGTGLQGQHPYVFNGTTWDRLREPTADALAVTGLTSSAGQVFNGTTWDRIRSGGVTGMQGVAGAEAHDAPVTGNPVLLGARGSTAAPGATSADGDVSRLWSTRQGTLRVYDSRRRRSGIYHLSLGASTVTAAADAATGGRWWLQVPVGATTYAAVRKIFFSMTTGTGLLVTTAPIFTVERFTFTGTASGASLAPAKRETGDATATAILRTASTGMTITAGNAAHGFQVPAALATTSQNTNAQVWPQGQDEDEWLILQGGEGIVIRQSTAGTALDTRVINMDIIWEEFASTDYQIRD